MSSICSRCLPSSSVTTTGTDLTARWICKRRYPAHQSRMASLSLARFSAGFITRTAGLHDRCTFAALQLGLRMLERPLPAAVEARVQHYVGQALARLTRPDEALVHLRRAQMLLEVEPDPWLAVECADWEACALSLKEDSRALSVAEEALRLCRATQPRLPGTEARILEHIATIHVKNHTFDQAIAYYEEALQAAGAVR